MRRITSFVIVAMLALGAALLSLPATASAHETREIADGQIRMVVGFMNEPVFAGDTITYSATLLETREQPSRPDRLIDTILCEGSNQHGEPVIRFESSVMEFV